MKALVLAKNGVLEYGDVDMPERYSEKSCLIRTAAAGICGSDMHRAFENGAYHHPLVMGHEFSGIVEEAFGGSRYEPGQRVVVFPLLPCRKCRACSTGDYAQCSSYDYYGSRRDGGFAEYVSVPEENLFPLPGHVNIVHAAMTEPCAVALHGVRKFRMEGGETAVVFGGGPIGNMAAQWLRIRGCRRVVVIDIDERKLRIALSMGFDVVNAGRVDPVKEIGAVTDGEGADLAVEACGLPLTYLQAVKSAARFGQVLFLGNLSGTFTMDDVDFTDVLRNELVLRGTWNSKIVPSGSDDWSVVLAYMDRELQVAPLISHTPLLSEGASIFNSVYKREEFYSKVIFVIDDSNELNPREAS